MSNFTKGVLLLDILIFAYLFLKTHNSRAHDQFWEIVSSGIVATVLTGVITSAIFGLKLIFSGDN